MNPELLLRCARDPVEFRRNLIIDKDGSAVPFKPDPWQEEDFRAMDDAWRFTAGRKREKPKVTRAWQERPRGHSKTADLAIQVTWAMLFSPRALVGIVAAGDREQAGFLADAIGTLARLNPFIDELLDVQVRAVVNKTSGSKLRIISSDADTSFGELPDFIAVDEITHWPEERGAKLWTSVASSMAKRDNCICVVICNAGFTEHFAYRAREKVLKLPSWVLSHLEGSKASWITQDRLEEQEALLPSQAAFDRLWNNIWCSGIGDALSQADVLAAILPDFRGMTGEEEGWFFYAGMDLSVTRDRSALVVIGKDQYGRLRLAKVYTWKPPRGGKIDFQRVRETLIEVNDHFHPWVFYDPYQAELLAADCKQAGVWMEPVAFQGAASMEMASALIETFTARNIDLFQCQELIDDLKRLRIEEKASGWRLAAERTAAGHCDSATALALAVLAAKRSLIAGGPFQAPMLLPMPHRPTLVERQSLPSRALRKGFLGYRGTRGRTAR